MSIGENIKKWREYRNLKQTELAEMLGVSDKTVSSWEINRTEPKMGMVEKISSALRCKKTDIIGSDDSTTVEDSYQLSSEVRVIAQELNENPELCAIFRISGRKLIDNYGQLSDINKKKVINYSDNLLAIQRMEEEQSHLIPEAAHDRTDIDVTPDLVKKDDDIMDNDDEWK